MTNTKNRLEILVVEDREENIAAAKTALADKVNLDFATNYEDGLKKMQTNIYAGAILDVQIPKKYGEKPEILGWKLGMEAEKYMLPYMHLTGISLDGNHGGDQSLIFENYGDVKKAGIELYWSQRYSARSAKKSDPAAWQSAFNELNKVYTSMEGVFESRKLLQKISGRSTISIYGGKKQ